MATPPESPVPLLQRSNTDDENEESPIPANRSTEIIRSKTFKIMGFNKIRPAEDDDEAGVDHRQSDPGSKRKPLKSRASFVLEDLVARGSKFLPATSQSKDEALQQIQDHLSGKGIFLLDPRSRMVKGWDSITVVALVFTALVTPYELAFLANITISNGLFWINRLVDLIFIVDMVMQFFMMYYDGEHDIWVHDTRKIAFIYLKSWFLLDLISVMPFDVIGIAVGDSGSVAKLKVIRIMKLLRLVKLLRVLRIARMFQRIEEALNISYKSLQLVTFAAIVCTCAHWMACALMITTSVNICSVSRYYSGECTNWIYYYNDNGGNGGLLKVDPDDGQLVAVQEEILSGIAADPLDYPPALRHFSVYWAAVYWAAMTMSTIGYGDVTPQTDSERVYVVVGMCFGASIYAYMVGNVCNILASMAAGEEMFRQEMDTLNKFMVERYIPKGLKARLREYYRYRNGSIAIYGTMDILHTLSPFLRMEVSDYTEAYWLMKSDMFEGFPREMAISLCLSIVAEVFVPGEIVFEEGKHCDRLYITERGVVVCHGKFYGRPNHSMRSIVTARKTAAEGQASEMSQQPCWIGLSDMMSTNGLYRHSAVSLTNSVLLTLGRDDVDLQLSKFPRAQKAFRRKMVRHLVRDLILQYTKAIHFITTQTEESLMSVLFPSNTDEANMINHNWILKYKMGSVLGLAVIKLGPDSPLSKIIKSASHSANIIQAAYRGMVARRKINAEYELQKFLKNQEHGSELQDEPTSLSIKEKVKWRAAKKRTTFGADVLVDKVQRGAPDGMGSTGLVPLDAPPGIANVIGEGQVGGSLGKEALQHKRTVKHNISLRSLDASPLSASIQPSAGPVSSAAIDNGLLKQDVKKLRKQVTRMEESFREEMSDIKRIVREIASRQHMSNSGGGGGGGVRKSGALSKINM